MRPASFLALMHLRVMWIVADPNHNWRPIISLIERLLPTSTRYQESLRSITVREGFAKTGLNRRGSVTDKETDAFKSDQSLSYR